MIDSIYIEEEIKDHPRVISICERFPNAERIICHRYGEVFNRKAQNFRLQKQQPALILAKKHKKFVLPAPDGYGIGGARNFYFSHMLNCLYDCRYCFLQGMYRSAHYVLFVNYEDYAEDIIAHCQQTPETDSYYFSGYDCDSLALEPVTQFLDFFMPLFRKYPQAWLELRTKSTQIRKLLEQPPIENCVVAYSLSPEPIAQALEHKAPSLQRRLESLAKLQAQGWNIGLRFDPLIYHENFSEMYRSFFAAVFQQIKPDSLHSVSLGAFRLPEGYFRNVVKLYPYEKLFAGPLQSKAGMVAYETDLEQTLLTFCQQQILNYIPQEKFFPCQYGG